MPKISAPFFGLPVQSGGVFLVSKRCKAPAPAQHRSHSTFTRPWFAKVGCGFCG
jgi:hypothetical protein